MKNIKDKTGKVLTQEDEILERWKKYSKRKSAVAHAVKTAMSSLGKSGTPPIEKVSTESAQRKRNFKRKQEE